MLEDLSMYRQAPSTAMTARKINEKHADMDYHAVPLADYRAGGDSKREERCQQDPQRFTTMATGTSPSSGNWK